MMPRHVGFQCFCGGIQHWKGAFIALCQLFNSASKALVNGVCFAPDVVVQGV